MRDWSQESFPLTLALVREIFRDATAMVGKANSNQDPAAFCQRTIGNLNLDRPPVPQRPKIQRKAVFANVQILLFQTGTWVFSHDFSEKGWMEATAATKVEKFAKQVAQNQQPV